MDKKPLKTFSLLKLFDEKYKQFIDSPTKKNFKLILDLGEQYKESWIEDMSNPDVKEQISSDDLDPHAPINQDMKTFFLKILQEEKNTLKLWILKKNFGMPLQKN